MRKALILVMVAIMSLFVCQGAFAADDKIGFVDDMAILRQYPRFQEAQKQLEEIGRKKSDSAKAAFDKEPDEKKKAQIAQNLQFEMRQEESKLINPILQTVNETIEKVAKQKGVTIVLNKSLIYYGGIDLTNDVVTALKR